MTNSPGRNVDRNPGGPRTAVLYLLFFLSGASALIYEVVWGRTFTFVFGGSAPAIATVLAAFMAGLAIGSAWFGRRIDRGGDPVRTYALLEAGIGLWALILPFLLSVANRLYAGLRMDEGGPGPAFLLARFLLSFLLLLVPTILMGGTLPVLSKFVVTGAENVGRRTGLLFALNTLGAVLGTMAAGFLLIPAVGMWRTTVLAVLINGAIAATAWFLSPALGRPPAPPAEKGGGEARLDARARTVLLVYAASGFAALAYEVIWVKVLALVVGTTTYAFTTMLATFLLGLAIGSFLVSRRADRIRDPALALAVAQIAIAVLSLATVPVLGYLPDLFVGLFRRLGASFGAQTATRFLLAALIMFLPTLLMGATFPLVSRLYASRVENVGRRLGTLYTANTTGAILGSLAGGFLLIPLLGRQYSILAAALVNVAAGLALLAASRESLARRAPRIVVAATLLLLVPAGVLALRRWDPYVMASGAYVYVREYLKHPDFRAYLHEATLLYYDEEPEALLAVWREQNVIALKTNGKTEASTSRDMLTQRMIAHLPSLLHPAPRSGLMIGLASGISLGSMERYPYERLTCVEMLGGMREASAFFREWNGDCLADPRLRLVIEDGRNFLLLDRRRYDVLVSQPSNPWIEGIGNLFTREFFQLARDRLEENGIFCQWVQTYQMSPEDLHRVLGTLAEVFPWTTVWTGSLGDLVVLAAREPHRIDWTRLSALLATPGIREELEQVDLASPEAVVSCLLTDSRGLAAYLGRPPEPITDDNLALEFTVSRNLYRTQEEVGLADFIAYQCPPEAVFLLESLPADSARAIRETLARGAGARAHLVNGLALLASEKAPLAVTEFEAGFELAPYDPLLRRHLGEAYNEVGIRYAQQGLGEQGTDFFRRALLRGSMPERVIARNGLGFLHFSEQRYDSAKVEWEAALALEPQNPITAFNLGLLGEVFGDTAYALTHYETTLVYDPRNAQALNNLAWLLAGGGRALDRAEGFARRAVREDPSPGNRDTLAWILHLRGRPGDALEILEDALREKPGEPELEFHRGEVLLAMGRDAEAREIFRKLLASNAAGAHEGRIREVLGGTTP